MSITWFLHKYNLRSFRFIHLLLKLVPLLKNHYFEKKKKKIQTKTPTNFSGEYKIVKVIAKTCQVAWELLSNKLLTIP